MSFKRFFVAVFAAIATVMFVSCDNLNVEKTLKGTTWSTSRNKEDVWWVLNFTSETSVVMTCYESENVEGASTGTYTYEKPTVCFSFPDRGLNNKFNATVTGNTMSITWIDDECEIEVEGLVFKSNLNEGAR